LPLIRVLVLAVSYYANMYLQSDLDDFFRNFSPALVGKSPELISIDGGTSTEVRRLISRCCNASSCPFPGTGEQDQDTDVGETGYILQYTMSLAQPQPV